MKRWVLSGLIFLCYFVATLCLSVLVLNGFAMTWLYRRRGWPDEVDAINCFAFAIPRWLRAGARETYLVTRMSKHTNVPHVLFAKSIDGLEVEERRPYQPQRGWRGFLHAFWHKGRVRKGEGDGS